MTDKNSQKTPLVVELNDKLENLVEFLVPIRTFLVFLSSVLTIALSMLLAFYFRFDFSFPAKEISSLEKVLVAAVIIKLIVFLIFRLYEGMWRFVSISDLLKILYANLLASGLLTLCVLVLHKSYFHGFARTVLVIDFLLCFLLMSGKRVAVRVVRESAAKASGERNIRTAIVGNAENINSLIQAFVNVQDKRKIVGVLCGDEGIGRSIRGIPVFGHPDSAAKCAAKHKVSELLLLPPYSAPANIKRLMDELEERQVKCELRMLPDYSEIASGKINVSYIKEVEIEDLLGRKPVKLDRTDVAAFVKGKNVMVTGAGGSIGSELCSQLASYKPEKLLLFELSEFNLYTISMKLTEAFPELKIINIIGDVRCPSDLERAIKNHNINVIYHAAAYKHVPLMEENPSMAFLTNVCGTANLAETAEKYGVGRLVFISTDKAVRPTSFMGSTKRIAERCLLERKESGTEFVVVRFGNVLGSSGSVIPRFKEQIRKGGPVTVTSENMVRFFMSIPEAVDLVLQAGAIGRDRDIMVLEMGEPVRIYDMAKKIIELSGFIPGKDIEIKLTGLRPGEKEYEELLTDEEKVDRTPYDRIYVARKETDNLPPSVNLELVRTTAQSCDYAGLEKLVREYIPENKFHERA